METKEELKIIDQKHSLWYKSKKLGINVFTDSPFGSASPRFNLRGEEKDDGSITGTNGFEAIDAEKK